MLLTRGYRLDEPRDMYFDEVYHARTAFELLAQREPYEWTHPHLAKEIMALSIPLFGGDRIVGTEPVPATSAVTAFTAANDGPAATASPTERSSSATAAAAARDLAHLAGPPRALVIEGSRVLGATDNAVFEIDLAAGERWRHGCSSDRSQGSRCPGTHRDRNGHQRRPLHDPRR